MTTLVPIPIYISGNINDYALMEKRYIDAKNNIRRLSSTLPFSANSILTDVLKELTDNFEKNEESYSKELNKLVVEIDKNCKDSLAAYKQARGSLFCKLNTNADFLYGITGNQPVAAEHVEFNDQLKKFNMQTRYDNSILVYTSSYVYSSRFNLSDFHMIFPKNGFKFLWSRDMNMATPSISQLFDETKLKKAFAELTAADPTFGQNYNDFYFPWSYKQNIEKVKKKAEDSSLDNSILKLFDPNLLITKVNDKFNSNINDALNVDYSSFLLNGEFYAISTKYMNYFSKKLGIRNAIT